MNQATACFRKVRVVFETRNGDFRSRCLDITAHPGDSAQTLMTRAGDAYRRRFGIHQRIVAIHLNAHPPTAEYRLWKREVVLREHIRAAVSLRQANKKAATSHVRATGDKIQSMRARI